MPEPNNRTSTGEAAAGAKTDSPAGVAKPAAPTQAKTKPDAAQSSSSALKTDANDPVALLKVDHRKVEGLFDAYQKAPDGQKAGLVRQICVELAIHTLIEEEIFYPACRRAAGEDDEAEEGLNEAQVEHDGVKPLIADLWEGAEGDDFRDAKVNVLAEMIRHHIGEEEKPGEGVFAKAEKQGVDNPDVARRLRQRKQALQADQERSRLQPGAPVSFRLHTQSQPRPESRFAQENDMPRNNGPERDDRGRFTSGDDDRGGRNYGARTQGGSYARDDDDRRGGRGQGGWFDDPQGHSQASREGWDERRGEGRSYGRGRDDEDDRRGGRGQGGWFGDSDGHSRAAREGWDNPDHGRSGWYGDSRGHSEASQRGWDNPDHGRSGWYGDSRGHSEASQRGWDDPDHGRSGWYGDPRGHSEASRQGWDERRDDDRGSRSRGRDDDDDRRGGRNQGGWFGDSQGHSEASRRGWQDRR